MKKEDKQPKQAIITKMYPVFKGSAYNRKHQAENYYRGNRYGD